MEAGLNISVCSCRMSVITSSLAENCILLVLLSAISNTSKLLDDSLLPLNSDGNDNIVLADKLIPLIV